MFCLFVFNIDFIAFIFIFTRNWKFFYGLFSSYFGNDDGGDGGGVINSGGFLEFWCYCYAKSASSLHRTVQYIGDVYIPVCIQIFIEPVYQILDIFSQYTVWLFVCIFVLFVILILLLLLQNPLFSERIIIQKKVIYIYISNAIFCILFSHILAIRHNVSV